jgi:hypothetical protein
MISRSLLKRLRSILRPNFDYPNRLKNSHYLDGRALGVFSECFSIDFIDYLLLIVGVTGLLKKLSVFITPPDNKEKKIIKATIFSNEIF